MRRDRSADSSDTAAPQAPVLPPWIVGHSQAFNDIVDRVARLADFDVTVLVQGETGVGKEMVVRLLHYLGRRADRPFVPVNAGAIPDSLFEDELFGHAAGAYTGARGASPGLIALAEGGTLFLDEIDSLSSHAQAALLRFLQDGCYRPVGARGLVQSQVRVITATNADPRVLLERGALREDLYFRLSGITLAIPPLRERRDDILPLAAHFLAELNARHRPVVARRLGAAMQGWLVDQPWPGNVRELRSAIERAFIMCTSPDLDPPGAPPAATPACAASVSFRDAKARAVEDFERRFLMQALIESRGNIALAARSVGKERKAFDRLLRKHGIDRDSYRYTSCMKPSVISAPKSISG